MRFLFGSCAYQLWLLWLHKLLHHTLLLYLLMYYLSFRFLFIDSRVLLCVEIIRISTRSEFLLNGLSIFELSFLIHNLSSSILLWIGSNKRLRLTLANLKSFDFFLLIAKCFFLPNEICKIINVFVWWRNSFWTFNWTNHLRIHIWLLL